MNPIQLVRSARAAARRRARRRAAIQTLRRASVLARSPAGGATLLALGLGLTVALLLGRRRRPAAVPPIRPAPVETLAEPTIEVIARPRRPDTRRAAPEPPGWRRRLAVAAAVVGAMLAVGLLVRQLYGAKPGDAINLVMFYHPPSDGTPVQTLAERFDLAIFTRGDESYRDQMRSAGFRGSVLQYLLANQTSGPADLRNSNDRCGEYLYYQNNVSGIAGDFCAALHADERNFLHNGRGERLYKKQSWQSPQGTQTAYLYHMNPASATWRSYFVQRARDNAQTLGYTGLLLDNIDATLFRARRQEDNADGTVAEYADDEAYRDAVIGYLAFVRSQLWGMPLWVNLTNSYEPPVDFGPYLSLIDGAMSEYFVARWENTYASPESWEGTLRQAETALSRGKGFVGVAQGARGDAERMRFALASYLLVAADNAYFRYASDADYASAWLYEDYQVRLGKPRGERHLRDGLWRREFACGYVTVDPASHVGTIVTERLHPLCW